MSSLRDMLDSPTNHPGLFRAIQANSNIQAGGPGSGRHKVGDKVKPVGGDKIKHVIDIRYDTKKNRGI